MLGFIRGSSKLIVVLHEIYGVNKHMEQVCEKYCAYGFDVICPNMLGIGEPFPYDREEAAYRHFMDNVGFEKAAGGIIQLVSEVKTSYDKVFLVGFSAGATVAWLCSSSQINLDGINGMAGYYGSRIRDYIEAVPMVPALLIFPEEEKAFDVRELLPVLKNKSNVEVRMLGGRHGFSDPYSLNYHKQSACKAEKLLCDFLKG